VTTQWGVFAIAASRNARDVLKRKSIKDADPETVLKATKRFPWLTMRQHRAGDVAVRAIRGRLYRRAGLGSCTTRSRCRTTWFDLLEKAGEKHGQ